MRVAASHKIEHRRGRSMTKIPYRVKLKALRERAGLSGAAMAKALGYASPPGYFRHEQEKYQGDRPIAEKKVQKMVPLLMGRGSPPITAEEIWALTEKAEVPRKLEPVDKKSLLPIKYRIDPDKFVRPGSLGHTGGMSRITASPDYPVEKQFIALNTNGDQLHCVEDAPVYDGRRCVLSVAYDSTELVEIVIANVFMSGNEMHFVRPDSRRVTGRILGVVIGAYILE